MVSTHLKNISQIGNLPQISVKIKKIYETTNQLWHFFSRYSTRTCAFRAGPGTRVKSHRFEGFKRFDFGLRNGRLSEVRKTWKLPDVFAHPKGIIQLKCGHFCTTNPVVQEVSACNWLALLCCVIGANSWRLDSQKEPLGKLELWAPLRPKKASWCTSSIKRVDPPSGVMCGEKKLL